MRKYIIISIALLVTMTAAVSAEGYTFGRNLSAGSVGDDVSALQTWLLDNGFDIPAITSGVAAKGYFGEQTRQAVKRFQESEGLPNTGYFGPLSRSKIHDRNPGRTDSRSPIVNGIDAPTVLSVGEAGTWNVRATDPQNGTLSYVVDWGDTPEIPDRKCPEGYVCQPIASNASAPIVQQSSTFTHAYSGTRTYKVTFTVANALGLSTKSSVTVKVVASTPNALKIISPNGGEIWTKGTMQTIRWNSPAYFRATYADLKLVRGSCSADSICNPRVPTPESYFIVRNVSINQNSYSWNVGQYVPDVVPAIYPTPTYSVPEGSYLLQLCETGTTNCVLSNRSFKVTSGNITNIPQVTSPNGGETWVANSAQYLRWSIPTGMDPMTRLDLYLDQGNSCPTSNSLSSYYCPAQPPYTLDKNIPITMAYNWLVATDINNAKIPAGNYYFRVCVSGSTTQCDSSDKTFTIISGSPLKVCPSQKIINAMPNTESSLSSSYYIFNGSRHELTEFDQSWVSSNCVVPEQVVY